jgi:hypothetical protein
VNGAILKGTCLCGIVTIEVAEKLERAPEACHCSQCRKQSGHYLAAINVRRAALKVGGSDRIAWYQSSAKVRRGFCSICGSTLFWEPTVDGYEYTAVAMGIFESPTRTQLAKHTFVADKGDYYEILDGLPQSDSY